MSAPLDLDAMEAMARARLAVFIDAKAAAAADKIRSAHKVCVMHARDRHQARLAWHLKSQRDFTSWMSVRQWLRDFEGEIYKPPYPVIRNVSGQALPGLLTSIAGALAFALALGALGPTLDAIPDQRSEWLQAEQELHQAGALARWEAEARNKCTRIGGENAVYIQVQGGGIRCTTKRGHVIAKEGRP